MTIYGTALFLHVVFAIALVASGAYTHVGMALVPRARSVDGMRAHAMWLHVLVKATGPCAVAVLVTGVYLAFAGDWWGAGWPVVSLVLFALAGAAAMGLIDPRVARLRETLEGMPDGPVTRDVARGLVDPTLRLAGSVLGGADLAIVFLMTNKPGWFASVLVGLFGLTVGGAAGVWASRAGGGREPEAHVAPGAAV